MPGADTIFAVSSGAGRAGVAVIRVSGANAGAAYRALAGGPLPRPRLARRIRLRDPESGEPLDDALALWFPAPASYSGEDMVEFHIHGGGAVIGGVIGALASRTGLRPAEPGEFTRRAFENGKLDLTAAEAVADLVAAETEAQRRQALAQMRGGLAEAYESWRQRLVRVLAHMEAEIDFADEDLPEGVAAGTRPEIEALIAEIGAHLEDGRRGELLRDGVYIAILGAPNVGKSSLLNALARREAAIVSAAAGTTRDVIEVHLDLGGFPVVVADTAGLREIEAQGAGAEVEREGVRRALLRAQAADLKLAVFDATAPEDPATAALVDEHTVAVANKSDLLTGRRRRKVTGPGHLPISAKTGAGMEALLARLEREVAARLEGGEAPALTRARHRAALGDCTGALGRSLAAELPELGAEDVRLAARALGRITGRVDVEDVLDVIFREFCIGK